MKVHSITGGIAYILVIIGALNWGLIGIFGINLIAHLFGVGALGAKISYILIGLSAIIVLLR